MSWLKVELKKNGHASLQPKLYKGKFSKDEAAPFELWLTQDAICWFRMKAVYILELKIGENVFC